jgi:hypothetical protein
MVGTVGLEEMIGFLKSAGFDVEEAVERGTLPGRGTPESSGLYPCEEAARGGGGDGSGPERRTCVLAAVAISRATQGRNCIRNCQVAFHRGYNRLSGLCRITFKLLEVLKVKARRSGSAGIAG